MAWFGFFSCFSIVFDLGEQGGRLCKREQFGNICAGKTLHAMDKKNGKQGREVWAMELGKYVR